MVSSREAYSNGFDKNGVTLIEDFVTFVDKNTVEVNGKHYSADHILIATGGRPTLPKIPGAELGIDSDGFFELTEQAKRTLN